jgi:hypothetical protein
MLKYLDDGNRVDFFRLWSEHIPSNVIDSDPSLKSLEFLIYAHFAIYYLRTNCSNKVVSFSIQVFYLINKYLE